MQEQLDRMEAKLDLLLDNAGKEAPAVSTATETGEIIDRENWPEWFSLGHGMKGWTVGVDVAEGWRIKSGFTEEYCLDKIYVIRSQWTEDNEKKGGNPYERFQRACREDWGSVPPYERPALHGSQQSTQQHVTVEFSHAQVDYDRRWAPDSPWVKADEARKADSERQRELREAEERQ